MADFDLLIDTGMVEGEGRAIRPAHFDKVDGIDVAQAEMGDGFHLAEITAATVNDTALKATSGREGDERTTGGRAVDGEGTDAQPMVVVGGCMIEREGLHAALAVGDEQFEAAIGVDVGDGCTGAEAAGFEGITDVDLLPFTVTAGKEAIGLTDVVEENFFVAVVVEIGGDDGADAAGRGHLRRGNVAEVAPEALHIEAVMTVPIATDQIEEAVVVGIQDGNTARVLVGVGKAGDSSDFLETALPRVEK